MDGHLLADGNTGLGMGTGDTTLLLGVAAVISAATALLGAIATLVKLFRHTPTPSSSPDEEPTHAELTEIIEILQAEQQRRRQE